MVLINSGATHNFVSAALVQAVKATTINAEPICVTLGHRLKVLTTRLAKISIVFTSGAAQAVWCHVMPKLSASVIFRMEWLTQINLKINWSEKMIKWTSNDTNVLLKAKGLSRMCGHVG